MDYDVFNGDADGICSLHQLRLAKPRNSRLISGVKRDISLLKKISHLPECRNSQITVLDISIDKNRDDLRILLKNDNAVFYADHHYPGDIPNQKNLEAIIDPDTNVCTGLLVDRMLEGRFRPWAIAAAFGDNLHDTARELGQSLDLNEKQLAILRKTGELLNYNGYGKEITDLHYPPEDLYKAVSAFEDPFAFYQDSEALTKLREGFDSDLAQAQATSPLSEGPLGRIFSFPNTSWPRRIAGVFSNEIARESPEQGHAVLIDNGDGSYLVSVRAPLVRKKGAANLCRHFPTGGGREAAAGINSLPFSNRDDFINRFHRMWS